MRHRRRRRYRARRAARKVARGWVAWMLGSWRSRLGSPVCDLVALGRQTGKPTLGWARFLELFGDGLGVLPWQVSMVERILEERRRKSDDR